MQQLKQIAFCCICMLLNAPAFAQQTTITDPIKYNDYIVDRQNNIGSELMILVGMLAELPTDRAVMTTQLNKLVKECDKSIADLNSLKAIDNEFNLRIAALDLFKFYKVTMNTDYVSLIDELYKETPDMDNLNTIIAKVEKSEAIADTNFGDAQAKFAAYHNIELTPNELQEELDDY